MNVEALIKLILRIMGTSSLFALIFVVAPRSWMIQIHGMLGMGELPTDPVVGYLARSTSAFYTMIGGLFWLLSFDLPRYRQVLIYLGTVIALLGIELVFVDWSEGMPPFWTLWEGPFVFVFGSTLCLLSRRVAVSTGSALPRK